MFLTNNQLTDAASDAARTAVVQTTMGAAESAGFAALQADVAGDGIAGGCSNTSDTAQAPTSSSPVICTALPASGNASCANTNGLQGFNCLTVTVAYDYADKGINMPLIPAPSVLSQSSTVLIGNGSLSS